MTFLESEARQCEWSYLKWVGVRGGCEMSYTWTLARIGWPHRTAPRSAELGHRRLTRFLPIWKRGRWKAKA